MRYNHHKPLTQRTPQASITTLTAIGGMGGTEALVAMGLVRVDVDLQ